MACLFLVVAADGNVPSEPVKAFGTPFSSVVKRAALGFTCSPLHGNRFETLSAITADNRRMSSTDLHDTHREAVVPFLAEPIA
jgi:hypothetical protein